MRKTTGLLALAAIAAFGFVGPALANGDDNHGPKGYDAGTGSSQPCNDDSSHSIAYVGPTRLWPPNHRDVNATVVATGHSDDDVTLHVTGVDNDTNQDSDFAAGADADGTGKAEVPVTFVRERSGTAKAGRVYTVTGTATFTNVTRGETGDECTKSFCVVVPHDMRPENRSGDAC